MSSSRTRIVVLTGAVASITVMGAIYGAGLKTQQEFQQEKAAFRETSPADRITQLETARARLVTHREELQRKIERLTAAAGSASGNSSSSA